MPTRKNRRLFSRTASREEQIRVELERKGIDCKVARKLAREGIGTRELEKLATGSTAEFIKENIKKLSQEDLNYLIEKYS